MWHFQTSSRLYWSRDKADSSLQVRAYVILQDLESAKSSMHERLQQTLRELCSTTDQMFALKREVGASHPLPTKQSVRPCFHSWTHNHAARLVLKVLGRCISILIDLQCTCKLALLTACQICWENNVILSRLMHTGSVRRLAEMKASSALLPRLSLVSWMAAR